MEQKTGKLYEYSWIIEPKGGIVVMRGDVLIKDDIVFGDQERAILNAIMVNWSDDDSF
jgi:hypothetical protein